MKPFPITQNRHRMKNLSRLIPLLVLAPLAHAQEVDIDDASGYVAPLTINLVVSETTGGYAISAAKKESDAAKGVTYPDFTTFQTTYQPDTPVSAIINPFGWDAAKGNNYVEKVTTKLTDPEAPVVTAAGSYKVTKTRYTNATLLADLVAAGIIPTATGYRLVAVRFNVAGDSHYDTPTHLTDVNTGYYFFAEMGAKDPSPVYLGAERDDMFGDEKFIAFPAAPRPSPAPTWTSSREARPEAATPTRSSPSRIREPPTPTSPSTDPRQTRPFISSARRGFSTGANVTTHDARR